MPMDAKTIAPIVNLECSSTPLKFTFGLREIIRIATLDLREVELGPELTHSQSELLDDYQVKLAVIEDEETIPNQLDLTRRTTALDDLATAIRLVKDARVWMPIVTSTWPGEQEVENPWTGELGPVRFVDWESHADRWQTALEFMSSTKGSKPCVVGGKDAGKIQSTMDALGRRPPHAGRLDNALRRFNMANDRPLQDDAIVDLFISLEAVLAKDANVRDLGVYLDKKAQFVLGQESHRAGAITECYWVRNQIVHGSTKNYNAVETFDILRSEVRLVLYKLVANPDLLDLVLETHSRN